MRMLPAHVPGIFSVTVSILMGFRPSTLIRCVSTFDQNAQRISMAEGLSASKCIVTIRFRKRKGISVALKSISNLSFLCIVLQESKTMRLFSYNLTKPFACK